MDKDSFILDKNGQPAHTPVPRFDWVDGLKVIALLGILFNHLIEAFVLDRGAGSQNWLADPSAVAGSVAQRFEYFWDSAADLTTTIAGTLAWFGNEGPGIFILLSGFGLALSLTNPPDNGWIGFIRRRTTRLYPLYLASVLLFVPIWMLAAPDLSWNMAAWPGLAMLSGVRADPQVFGLLNPSWWFFWTILQLYLIFPLLWMFRRRFGVHALLLICLLITVAVRTYLLQFAGQMNLWPWLAGLIAVTRLAEFALGIWLAAMLLRYPHWHAGLLSPLGKLGALMLTGGGIAASLTVYGGAISQLLLTMGIGALLLSAWQLARRVPTISQWTPRLAADSYGTYLIHQPPLIILAKALGPTLGAMAAGLAWLAVAPFAAYLLNRAINWLHQLICKPSSAKVIGSVLTVGAVALLLGLPVVEPYLGTGRLRNLLTWALASYFVVTVWFNLNREQMTAGQWLRLTGATAAALTLWVFPDRGAAVGCLAAIGAATFVWLVNQFVDRTFRGAAYGLVVISAVGAGLFAESALRDAGYRLEAGHWGELPVLQLHETRGYALKPNINVELSYHYQYRVKTNADGFQGRAITARPAPSYTRAGTNKLLRIAVLGDAYTMPEVVPYEQSYTALLENRLQQCMHDRDVQIFNLGVTGYSPTEKAVVARETLPRIEPDIVIDQTFIAELDWMQMSALERQQEIGLLPATTTDYRRRWSGTQLYQKLLRTTGDLTAAYAGLPARWRYEISLAGYFRTNKRNSDRWREQQLALINYWKALKDQANEQRFELLAFYTPIALEVSMPKQLDYLPHAFDHPLIGALDLNLPHNRMRQAARDAEVPLLDPRHLLRSAARRGTQVYSPDYWHWTADGHRVAAQALSTLLAKQGLVPNRCDQDDAVKRMSRTSR